MFGLLRLLLAAMVVIGHLFWFSDIGRYAVFGFYLLSGYLMTTVMGTERLFLFDLPDPLSGGVIGHMAGIRRCE